VFVDIPTTLYFNKKYLRDKLAVCPRTICLCPFAGSLSFSFSQEKDKIHFVFLPGERERQLSREKHSVSRKLPLYLDVLASKVAGALSTWVRLNCMGCNTNSENEIDHRLENHGLCRESARVQLEHTMGSILQDLGVKIDTMDRRWAQLLQRAESLINFELI
jgi:hypothetical protein